MGRFCFYGVVLGLCLGTLAFGGSPVGYAVRSGVDDALYRINLTTGSAEFVGFVGFGDIEGLALNWSTQTLYGVNDNAYESLVTIDMATGAGSEIGKLFPGQTDAVLDLGLASGAGGKLYMCSEDPKKFYQLDGATGQATEVGLQGYSLTGLCFGNGNYYGLGGDFDNSLFRVNPKTGSATEIGSLGVIFWGGGLDFDFDGNLWALSNTGAIYVVDPETGQTTWQANTLDGFNSLAIPEPVSLALIASGGWIMIRRKR